jgi:transcriptional regulator with XRE-family HTH domain
LSGPDGRTIEPVYGEVGAKIQRLRLKRGMTQAALAASTSLSRTSVANIERGEQRFMLHTLFDFATGLGVSADRLIPRDPRPMEERVKSELEDMEDDEAVAFIKQGLKKAGLIS